MNLKELSAIMGKFATASLPRSMRTAIRTCAAGSSSSKRTASCTSPTSSEKSVYRQMVANPKVAYTCDVNGYHVRISGTAVIVKDAAEKEEIYRTMDPGVQAMYPTIDSNGFTVFYIEHGTASMPRATIRLKRLRFDAAERNRRQGGSPAVFLCRAALSRPADSGATAAAVPAGLARP